MKTNQRIKISLEYQIIQEPHKIFLGFIIICGARITFSGILHIRSNLYLKPNPGKII
jgi:hypothetical protein